MKLRAKLPLFTSITVIVAIIAVAIYSSYQFKKTTRESIDIYRVEETEKILNNLKDIVNIAYSMIEHSYQSSSKEQILERYGIDIEEYNDDASVESVKIIAMNMLKLTKENLRVLRFGVDGYIWINDFEKPYTVRLHPIKPELEGKDWVFYIEDKDVNVYEAFHDSIVAGNGEGQVFYNFYKPGSKERVPKLSYVKLYEPLGWVIGTGVYIDHIDKMVQQKTEEMYAQIRQLNIWVFIIGIFIIFLASFSLYLFGESITKPIFRIEEQLYDMSKGKIVSKLDIERKDEIGSMKKSLDELIEGFSAYSKFAIEIGKGNFESEFTPLSKDDVIGNSLLEMRRSLRIAQEEENQRKLENAKRQWTSEGLTLIGDVLRVNSSDIKKLSEAVIIESVKYLKANQGGVFILNDSDEDDVYLELMASVAYNRKKFIKKKISIGDGLIGQCFLEKEKIYMTNIPEDYIEIKSGLGTTNPRNLIIVPLKLEDNVLGIIEIASFNLFEEFEIEFIERIADSMAVSISTSKVSGVLFNSFEEVV